MKTVNKVELNIGGTKFTTTKDTLIQNSKYFKSLFEVGLLDLDYFDENGNQIKEIFIDQSPENFKDILDYMRNKNHIIPSNILYECDFYGIDYPIHSSSDKDNMIAEIIKKRDMHKYKLNNKICIMNDCVSDNYHINGVNSFARELVCNSKYCIQHCINYSCKKIR